MGLGVWWSSRRARTVARRGASSGSHGSALLAHARAGGGREGEEEDGRCLVGPGERPSKEQARGGRGTTTHLATTPWLASSVVFGRGKAGASSRGFGREMGREGGRG